MYRRPFLVLPGGDCVPLEGDWRIEMLRGEWYVLGHHEVHPCHSERDARLRLDHLRGGVGPNEIAAYALEDEGDAENPRAPHPPRAPFLGEADLIR